MRIIIFFVMLLLATPVFAKTEVEFDAEMERLTLEIKRDHPEVIWVDCESPLIFVDI